MRHIVDAAVREKVQAYCFSLRYAERTTENYVLMVNKFARFTGKPLSATTQADIDAFIRERRQKVSKASMAVEISILRMIIGPVFGVLGPTFPKQSVDPVKGNRHTASTNHNKGHRLLPEEKEAILAAPDHLSYDEIAVAMGISSVSVIRILKKAGRPPRKTGRRRLSQKEAA